jgi:hypothetical protein
MKLCSWCFDDSMHLCLELFMTDYAVDEQAVDEHLTATYGRDYTRRKVQWCFTVPAGWSQNAKQAMVDAAVTAGLVDDSREASTRIKLLYEVSEYCKNGRVYLIGTCRLI